MAEVDATQLNERKRNPKIVVQKTSSRQLRLKMNTRSTDSDEVDNVIDHDQMNSSKGMIPKLETRTFGDTLRMMGTNTPYLKRVNSEDSTEEVNSPYSTESNIRQ